MAMSIKKTVHSVAFIGLVCGSYQPLNADNEFAKGLVALGAAAASVGGLLWAVSSLTQESDVQIAERAERELHATLRTYEPYLSAVENTLSAGVTAGSIEEKSLYAIAQYIEQNAFYNLAFQINSVSSRLRSLEQELSYRSIQAQKDHVYGACHGTMRRVSQAISTLCDRIERVSRIVEPHRSYIQLFLAELSVRKDYVRELDVMQNYQHDPYQQSQALKRIIVASGNSKYPCINYVKTIDRTIDNLSRTINNCAYYYHDRIGWAKLLNENLLAIKGSIVTDPLYSQELYAQRMENLEYERRQAAESLLRLEESRVREMRKANRIEEERLDLERAKLCQQMPEASSVSFNITVDTAKTY